MTEGSKRGAPSKVEIVRQSYQPYKAELEKDRSGERDV